MTPRGARRPYFMLPMGISRRIQMSKIRVAFAVAAALAGSACDVSTAPAYLQDFQWIAVERPSDVVEGMDVAAFQGDLALLGQIKTPTLCFRLVGNIAVNAPTVTVRITAEQANAPNCGNTAGGYQYTAAIRGLDGGDYTVRVIHSVPGSPDKEYSKSVSVR